MYVVFFVLDFKVNEFVVKVTKRQDICTLLISRYKFVKALMNRN